jgi:hypothetical protein
VPFLYMPILHRWKRWPWAVELVPAWAKELAGASKREQIEGELWHYLYEDLSNGLFDEPRADARTKKVGCCWLKRSCSISPDGTSCPHLHGGPMLPKE